MTKKIVRNKAQYQAAIREIMRNATKAIERARITSAQDFVDYCMNVLAYAVQNAPVDDGTLRGTAYLEIEGNVVATGEGNSVRMEGERLPIEIHARVVFPMPYALIQHEHPEFKHPKGGRAFYLEIGLEEATKEYLQRRYEALWG